MVASGIALLATAWLPSMIASLITVAELGGEHEIRCIATEDGFVVTLHHPQRARHHHNLLERVLLGTADEDEPDHHLSFSLSDRFSEFPETEMPPAAADLPPRQVAVALSDAGVLRSGILPPDMTWRAPPPLWRGVVMTI